MLFSVVEFADLGAGGVVKKDAAAGAAMMLSMGRRG